MAQDYAKAAEWYEKAAAMDSATAKAQLEKLPIRKAFGTRCYAEALRLQEALAARVEAAEIKREGRPGTETAEALNEVAWYALFARKFRKSLAAADRAHGLLPDDLGIEINRAHALMFLRHGKEAAALYLSHKGKPVSQQGGKPWDSVVVEDFTQIRKAGLMRPMMADIEKQFSVCSGMGNGFQ